MIDAPPGLAGCLLDLDKPPLPVIVGAQCGAAQCGCGHVV